MRFPARNRSGENSDRNSLETLIGENPGQISPGIRIKEKLDWISPGIRTEGKQDQISPGKWPGEKPGGDFTENLDERNMDRIYPGNQIRE